MGQIWTGSRVKADNGVKPKHSYFFSVWFIKNLERTNYKLSKETDSDSLKMMQHKIAFKDSTMYIYIMFHGILFDQLIIIKAQFTELNLEFCICVS